MTGPTAYKVPPGSQAPTNTIAIIALILGLTIPPGGIILGHIGLSQIKKSGEAGRGMALIGTISGYVLTIVPVVFVLGSLLLSLILAAASDGYGSGFYNGF